MERNSPHKIRTIDLKMAVLEGLTPLRPVEDEYQAFWWDTIPLGHRWHALKNKDEKEELLLAPLIWAAIYSTLEFYCSRQKTVSFDQLKAHWEDEQWEDFTLAIERILKDYRDLSQSFETEVSLIICTRNRAAALENCLASLAELSVQPKEVLVIDNAPDDDQTQMLVSCYPGVRYILESRKGLDHARNAGWMHATAPIVAYVDDDVRLHKDWIAQLASAFDHSRVQAVTSLVFAEKLDSDARINFEKYWSFNRGYQDLYYDIDYFKRHLQKGVPAWEIGAGASMAFRRSALQISGGFDPRLDVGAAGCSGDSEMWYRLMAEGWTIHYTPRAVAFHTHRREKAALKEQIYYYLRGATASLLVQHQRYGHRGTVYHLYKTLPVHYLVSAFLKARYPRSRKYDTLLAEVRGYLSGIRYFYKHRSFPASGYGPSLNNGEIRKALVTVIITVYNHGKFLPDAIESVLNQTYKPIALIVVDDGSTDDTRAVVSHYPNVKYIFQENSGLAAARNKGIWHSNGDFIVFLDADDLLYPGAIAQNMDYALKYPETAFVSGWHDRIDENKKLIATPENPPPDHNHYEALLCGNYIGMHATVMYRRQVFNFFLFDELLAACEDYDLYLRIAEKYPIFSHHKKLAAYRIHSRNMSGDIGLMRNQVQKVLDKNKPCAKNLEAARCYHQGKRNWDRYYATEIYKRIACRHSWPAYIPSLNNFFLLLVHLPARTVRLFLYKIRHKGWNLMRSNIAYMKEKIKRFLGYGSNRLTPKPGRIRIADLRRTVPLSRHFGYDRGGPVDRYYIETFLKENRDCIRGQVLEIGDNAYTRVFGEDRVEKSDILYIDDSNPNATIIGDLSKADHIPSDQFDCIILTQTLHLIYDFESAIKHCHRILKTGGVLLLTSPGISQIDYGQWGDTWYWSFTGRSISKLLTDYFDPLKVKVQTHGNVLAATAFLYGMGQNEISRKEKDDNDPHYQVIIAAKAIKN